MINIETTANYMPNDNTLLYTTEHEEPIKNVTASCCYMFLGNKIILANNRKRGLEISGGHVEHMETPKQACIRETNEETGSIINSPKFFMTAIHTCLFDKPENYKYPYPVSYINFYTCKDVKLTAFKETEECKPPELIEFVIHENGATLLPNSNQVELVHDMLERNIYFNIFLKEAFLKG